MRKVILSSWQSADGYFLEEGSALMAFMHTLPEDEEQERYGSEAVAAIGEHAMVSSTYRAWSTFWPNADVPNANAMNRSPKLVFTRGEELEADWGPVRIVRGEAAEELRMLKTEQGGDIVVHGGIELVHRLLRQGAFDELQLLLLPVAVGAGIPLFEDLGHLQPLRLVSTRSFASGLQEVIWQPAT